MNAPTVQARIQNRLERAHDAVCAAEVLMENNRGNGAADRLFFACFYSITALLLSLGLESQKHSGVRMLFNRHFVRPGLIEKKYAEIYNRLFDYRQEEDYDGLIDASIGDVTEYVDEVKGLIAAAETLLSEYCNT